MKFQQKILNSKVVGARQSFQFFRQKTWFLINNRALPTLTLLNEHYQIIIKSVHKKTILY